MRRLQSLIFVCLLVACCTIAFGCAEERNVSKCAHRLALPKLALYVGDSLKSERKSRTAEAVFKFRIREGSYDALKKYLLSQGFENWAEGGISYGSVDDGWQPDEDLIFSIKKVDGRSHVVALSRKESVFYAVITGR